MIYVMSDIHGNYGKYRRALETIKLSKNNLLILLGDLIDRGDNSIKILQDIMYRDNVIPVLGNHEYMAGDILGFLIREITDESLLSLNEDFIRGMQEWLSNGGQETLDEFKLLDNTEKREIVDFLQYDFEPYYEVNVNGIDYILVHAGLANFEKDRKLSDYKLHEIIFEKTDYNRKYYDDKILITGHTPTILIENALEHEIYIGNNHIAIDCGCEFDYGKLGVICLNTLEKFYV